MRPLFLQYPEDPKAFDQSYQYMFGDDLLVAPVLQPGVENWTVYLPGKAHIHALWSIRNTSQINFRVKKPTSHLSQ